MNRTRKRRNEYVVALFYDHATGPVGVAGTRVNSGIR